MGMYKLGVNGTALNYIIKVQADAGGGNVLANNSMAFFIPGIVGVDPGSTVFVSPSGQLPVGISIASARVSAPGTIELVLVNSSGADIAMPLLTFYFSVIN
jgi:hypothetical protein